MHAELAVAVEAWEDTRRVLAVVMVGVGGGPEPQPGVVEGRCTGGWEVDRARWRCRGTGGGVPLCVPSPATPSVQLE